MNLREIYDAVDNEAEPQRKRALLELVSTMKVLTTAVLELAGHEKLKTGRDPLMLSSRMILADFVELESEQE